VFHEIISGPQPVTYSSDSGARTARWLFGLDSTNPLARMTASDDYVFAPRVQTAINSVCGALHATLPARAIADDMDGVGNHPAHQNPRAVTPGPLLIELARRPREPA
jgi:hypothetical protein